MYLRQRYLLAVAVMVLAGLLPSPAAAAGAVTVVVGGLSGPRTIDFLGNDAVIAESGTGGATCFGDNGGPPCVGPTSDIASVAVLSAHPAREVIADGFFSERLGFDTIGVSGISVRHGVIYAQIGTTGRELPPTYLLGQQQAGHLIAVNPRTGDWRDIASVGNSDFDYTLQFTPPDPAFFGDPRKGIPPDPSKFNANAQEHDANPTGVLATQDGWLTADSGANTLTHTDRHGKITVLQHFVINNPVPLSFPSDAVPTCVARTDEAIWVGMLNGNLWKVQGSEAIQVVPRDANGSALLTHVTGCTSGPDDTLYLVNMFGGGAPFSADFFSGSVVQYKPDENRGTKLADAAGSPSLFLPYWPAIGPDGNLYVTAGTICDAAGDNPFGAFLPFNPCAGGGRVVRITLRHAES